MLKRHAWLVLGTLLAVFSVLLLRRYILVHVPGLEPVSELHMSVNTAHPSVGWVEVFFQRHKNILEISFAIPADRDEVVRLSVTNPVDAWAPCQARDGGKSIHGISKAGIVWAEYVFVGKPIVGRIAISCFIGIVGTPQTFAERKVRLQNLDDAHPLFWGAFCPTDLAAHIENFSVQDESAETRFEGGTPRVEGEDVPVRLLKWGKDEQIVASWTDLRRAQERDGALILIGAVVALSATCLLEWIRPWMSPEHVV